MSDSAIVTLLYAVPGGHKWTIGKCKSEGWIWHLGLPFWGKNLIANFAFQKNPQYRHRCIEKYVLQNNV